MRQPRDDFETQNRFEVPEEVKKLAQRHQLIIIPIFWKSREEQMNNVIEAARALKQSLVKYKINVWVDRRKALTPCQKYEYWEHIGCKFRLEIGPEEYAKGTVCISKVGTGKEMKSSGNVVQMRKVAERWRNLKVETEQDVFEVAKLLKEQGLDYINLEAGLAEIEQLPAEKDNTAEKQVAEIDIGGDSLDVNYLIE